MHQEAPKSHFLSFSQTSLLVLISWEQCIALRGTALPGRSCTKRRQGVMMFPATAARNFLVALLESLCTQILLDLRSPCAVNLDFF